MRKNQKGFTLVELIIAVAILAVVTVSVCGFIVVGSRSYTSANTDIMLQQEAQLALNQISDVIIDTTDSINYGNGTEMVLKDSEFSSEPDEKDLVVINSHDGLAPTDSSLQNNNSCYQFEWRKDTETIYFRESDAAITELHPEPDEDEWDDWAILAQHVKELHIDISQFEENRVVMISMTFQNGNKEYTTSNNVTVRNRVSINKIDIKPMKKAEVFIIGVPESVVLEPGETFDLNTKMTLNTTSSENGVVWELVDNGTTTSALDPGGMLTIGPDEQRDSFWVKVSRDPNKVEYANQNDKVAKTIEVQIKRVNRIEFIRPDTVTPGSTVTVSGEAAGHLVGEKPCENHKTDDLDNDKDLVMEGWHIVSGPAEIETRDSQKAEIKIDSTAQNNAPIVVAAWAMLPYDRGYEPIEYTCTLTVKKEINSAQYLQAEFRYGTDNVAPHYTFDYLFPSRKTDFGQYLFCVRIREAGTVGRQNDSVMVYLTSGANLRLLPDAFGLDLRKSYEVYFQMLDARPDGIVPNEMGEKYREMVKDEYEHHLDDNGKYIGDMFEAYGYYCSFLNPPVVPFMVDNEIYDNEESNRDRYIRRSLINDPHNPLIGGIDINPVKNLVINMFDDAALNTLEYTLYKEDINGNWKRICGVDFDTQDYPSESERKGVTRIGELDLVRKDQFKYVSKNSDKIEYSGDNTLGALRFETPRKPDALMRRIDGDLWLAAGTYHIVPGFVFANESDPAYMRDEYYKDKYVIIKDLQNPDYKIYYYKQWDNVINVKIDIGLNLNLELPKVNGEERWSSFPTPKDRTFPFDLRSENEQSDFYSFTQYNKNYEDRGRLGNGKVIVSCTYDAAKKEYKIKLKEIKKSGNKITTHIYGIYTYDAGDDEWDRVNGEYDEPAKELNLTYTKEGYTYDTFFPLPSDGDFPFKAGDVGEQVKDNWEFTEFRQNDGSIGIEKYTVNCTYDNGTYYIQLSTVKKTNKHNFYTYNYGTFKCNYGGTKWEQTEPGFVKEGTDLKFNIVVTIKDQQGQYKQYNSFFPAPTDGSFPISGSTYKLQIYDQGDLAGDSRTEQEVTAVYSNGELEFRKEEHYDWWNKRYHITSYGKYVYDTAKGQWEMKEDYWEYDEARWSALTYFKVNDGEYKAEIPLPGESGLPALNGDKEWKELVYYDIDDGPSGNNYGGNANHTSWGGPALCWQYTVDSANVYWLELLTEEHKWEMGNHTVEYKTWLKLKYDDAQKTWVQVN